ncbi:hypothetical protein AWJ19_25070 [Paenibacillus sp. DMB5]|nr:hypothetical protein AWJ19_28310 [Paenibacillus sp. DMB5]KUP26281.1 hypothetical protein AWJ19_25070 [Paenibacillus sp. DMB5]
MRQEEWYRGGVTRRLFIETAGFLFYQKAIWGPRKVSESASVLKFHFVGGFCVVLQLAGLWPGIYLQLDRVLPAAVGGNRSRVQVDVRPAQAEEQLKLNLHFRRVHNDYSGKKTYSDF